MFRSGFTRFAGLASVAVLAISACSGGAATNAPTTSTSTGLASAPPVAASPSATAYQGPGGGTIVNGHILVRWFVGLGSGTNPQQIALQQSVVSDFNKAQDAKPTGKGGLPILLSLEITQNTTATSILKTEMLSNNAPDVVGPVGIKGRVGFSGQWADITPLAKTAGVDLTTYPEAAVKAMSNSAGVVEGLPYAVYPSFIMYNKILFDEAKLSYPPQKVGDKYKMPDGSMVDWSWDTVRKIAMILSVDKNGKDATQAGFDPKNQTQFGFEGQWIANNGDGRRWGSMFGTGSFVAADGKTAQFPDTFKAAWAWYYNGIWTDHFIANATQEASTLLAAGNAPSTGRVGMTNMFLWYDCCMSPDATKANAGLKKWDIAVMPTYNGTTTAPTDLDTFSITKGSADPQDAMTALMYIAGRADLTALYGGIPYIGDQLAYIHKYVDVMLKPQFPTNGPVNWQVAIDMEKYAPVTHHEAAFPNYVKGMADYTKIFSTLPTTSGLDMNAIYTQVTAALQADFDSATPGS
jgi:multiple sugar transport system substrate-binding protein